MKFLSELFQFRVFLGSPKFPMTLNKKTISFHELKSHFRMFLCCRIAIRRTPRGRKKKLGQKDPVKYPSSFTMDLMEATGEQNDFIGENTRYIDVPVVIVSNGLQEPDVEEEVAPPTFEELFTEIPQGTPRTILKHDQKNKNHFLVFFCFVSSFALCCFLLSFFLSFLFLFHLVCSSLHFFYSFLFSFLCSPSHFSRSYGLFNDSIQTNHHFRKQSNHNNCFRKRRKRNSSTSNETPTSSSWN